MSGRHNIRTRDRWLDAARGFALLVMLFTHLVSFSPLLSTKLSHLWNFFGFFSMAEVFVIVSAVAAYRSYFRGRDWKKEKAQLQRRIFARAFKIYLAHLAILTSYHILAENSHPWPRTFQSTSETAHQLALWLTLLYQPPFGDILPLYVVYFLMLPLLANLLAPDSRPTLLVLSFVVWSLGQIIDYHGGMQLGSGVLLSYFNPVSWIGLFGISLSLIALHSQGYFRPYFMLTDKRISFWLGFCALLFFALRHCASSLLSDDFWLFSRPNLGLGRLVNVLCILAWGPSLHYRYSRLSPPKFLESLGRNSLLTYLLSVIFCYAWGFRLLPLLRLNNELLPMLALVACSIAGFVVFMQLAPRGFAFFGNKPSSVETSELKTLEDCKCLN